MPKFYLHIVYADRIVPDLEGISFTDLEEAKQEARDSLPDLVAQALLSRRPDIPLAINICSANGDAVASVATEAAIPQLAPSALPSSGGGPSGRNVSSRTRSASRNKRWR